MSILIRGGVVITMNDRFDIVEGDVSIRDGRIATVAPTIAEPHDRVIDARGGYVLPGLIQTHIHLCQTLFRGYADDLILMDWLRQRRWATGDGGPPEAARARRADGGGALAAVAARVHATGDDRAARERHDGRADDGDGARHGCGV